MLKTLGSTESTIRPEKSRIRVSGDSGGNGSDDGGYDDEHSLGCLCINGFIN